jgi:hypothetical protein
MIFNFLYVHHAQSQTLLSRFVGLTSNNGSSLMYCFEQSQTPAVKCAAGLPSNDALAGFLRRNLRSRSIGLATPSDFDEACFVVTDFKPRAALSVFL